MKINVKYKNGEEGMFYEVVNYEIVNGSLLVINDSDGDSAIVPLNDNVKKVFISKN